MMSNNGEKHFIRFILEPRKLNMDTKEELAINYFSSPKLYFWRWAEGGEVIESRNGSTICYRAELMDILNDLAPHGLPPLGSVLLVLQACQESWKNPSNPDRSILTDVIHYLKNGFPNHKNNDFAEHVNGVHHFMDIISKLPDKLKKGKARKHLIQEVFKYGQPRILVPQVNGLLQDFESGVFDRAIFNQFKVLTPEYFQYELQKLILAFAKFPDEDVLEMQVLTGLGDAPKSAELEIPKTDSEERILLQQLKEDERTIGIARLCERLMAGLNIPMHSKGVSDQPFGGISDITNRGDFDKLLLSELAYDDTTLMVRLANNEAMYLRREEIPKNINRERVILIDSTIKMWGVPRTFAISAALACAIQDKQISEISSYTLGGKDFEDIDLTSKKGVIKSLQQLDAHLHCGNGLLNFFEKNPSKEQVENIFITDEDSFENDAFKLIFSKIKKSLRFLVTISRAGEMHFFEYNNGQRKRLSTTRYDLDDLLFRREKVKRENDTTLPSIYQEGTMPMYFPTLGIRLSKKNTYYHSEYGVISLSLDNRLLRWPSPGVGAIELLENLEDTNYCGGFNVDEYNCLHIMAWTKHKSVKMYTFANGTYEVFDYSNEAKNIQNVIFNYGYFLLMANNSIVVNSKNGAIVSQENKSFPWKEKSYEFNLLKKHINPGYTAIKKAKSVAVNTSGDLIINGYVLTVENDVFKFLPNKKTVQAGSFARFAKDEDANFHQTSWTDGSRVILDSKGMIHLKSSDSNIPEITIPFVTNYPTAAWASDGTIAGKDYFLKNANQKIKAYIFYHKFIKRFIDTINKR